MDLTEEITVLQQAIACCFFMSKTENLLFVASFYIMIIEVETSVRRL